MACEAQPPAVVSNSTRAQTFGPQYRLRMETPYDTPGRARLVVAALRTDGGLAIRPLNH
jgi:hypothetical protein